MFRIKVVEKINTCILWSLIFFSENHAIYGSVKKYGRATQAAGDNIMWCRKDAVCILDNQGKNIDTLKLVIFNTYCFTTD